jgi:arylsulfatase A-like enzyme
VAAYFGGKPFTMQRENAAEHTLPDETVTLAETLRAANFRTWAFTANAVIGTLPGFNQGFDEYHFVSSPQVLNSSIRDITDAIKRDYRHSSDREFIYVHTMDAHYPYRPPAPYGPMFVREGYSGPAVIEGAPVVDKERTPAASNLPYWDPHSWIDDPAIAYLSDLYDACVRFSDSQLENLLAALDFDPETDLLIVTADHGEQFYELGWWSHFETLTPMETHVPLIIHGNGYAPRTVDGCVGLADLYPTILDLYDLPAPPDLFGHSLVEVLEGRNVPEHPVYAENSPKAGLSVAVTAGEYWYWMRLNRTQHEPWHAWPYEEYLFRYREDPGLQHNLVAQEPDVAAELNAKIREMNPRWAKFTRARIEGSDANVDRSENLMPGAMDALGGAGSVDAGSGPDGGWTVDTPARGFTCSIAGLKAGERYWFELPYTLESGGLRVVMNPVEYKRPGLGQVSYVWHRFLEAPAENEHFAVVVVPAADTIEFRLVFEPGTKGHIGKPELHALRADWVEHWPPPAEKWQYLENGEELERLKSLGYW